jgi:hypothetical protein
MKQAKNEKVNGVPDFVARAERAFRRVAVKVRAENRRFGLKDEVWPAGEKKEGT